MLRKPFLKQFSFVLLFGLAILFISSPASAQTIYSIEAVPASYVAANTVLSLRGDDACSRVPLPFTFTFYGVPYDYAYVSTNGYLNFIGPNSSYSNVLIPIAAIPNAAIYAFWDDLNVDSAASVRTELLGTEPNRQFVIEWRNVRFYNGGYLRIDFEIVLRENGVILLQYHNVADDFRERGNSATVGLENEAGNNAALFSYNRVSLGVGDFAIQFANLTRSVPADIKPMGCPNPFNVRSKGVLPFAILGTSDFDVTTIVPGTVTLSGVAPLRWSLEDVGTPYEPFAGKIDPYQCNDLGPDGYLDIVFKFNTQEIAASLGDVEDKDVMTLQLRGQLQDGTEISGEDVVIIKTGKDK